MECQQCGSDRILNFSGKTRDCCCCEYKGKEHVGPVPKNIGVDEKGGYGDYLGGDICLECGQVQGKFPVPDPDLKGEPDVDDDY